MAVFIKMSVKLFLLIILIVMVDKVFTQNDTDQKKPPAPPAPPAPPVPPTTSTTEQTITTKPPTASTPKYPEEKPSQSSFNWCLFWFYLIIVLLFIGVVFAVVRSFYPSLIKIGFYF